MNKVLYIISICLLFTLSTFSQQNKVLVINADCAIHPACADYIHSGLEKAAEENVECLIIKLNTPGGLLKSTRVIVTDILESKIPVVVYVSPSGSQAASAGVFITLAGHIAAMSPGTNIGAAHPVSLQGTQDTVMMEKATNDAAAFIRTISEKRKRNIEWAEDAVRKSLSITETEALGLNVIDIVAKDINDLLHQIDGKEVETVSGKRILKTKDAIIVEVEMTLAQKLLSILSDPNLAYILLMLGIYGLFFELYNPGAIFPGVVGGICIILAFYSMHTLPVNYAGLALIIFAVILFLLEIKIVSHGVLSIGGIISLLLGSMMLIDENSVLEAMEISMELIILVVVLTAAFFLFAITLGIKAQRKKTVTGSEGIVGEFGTAISILNPTGKIKVHGEIWDAECDDDEIKKGDKIEVVAVDHLKLVVKKKK
ncbi:MAG: nodulation protein NfeD [Ignavibacteriaceae bacterium]|nr:nodulation protein NfeD [Ignavibacteria bacterium]MBT8391316.1 nodulation protein NfeD [Ignavibacteria bacterium]NNJ53819.1 nodulation protein NfeD [Ignavibacteriaceae bacterium]